MSKRINFYYYDLDADSSIYVYDIETQRYWSPIACQWYYMSSDYFSAKVDLGNYILLLDHE